MLLLLLRLLSLLLCLVSELIPKSFNHDHRKEVLLRPGQHQMEQVIQLQRGFSISAKPKPSSATYSLLFWGFLPRSALS